MRLGIIRGSNVVQRHVPSDTSPNSNKVLIIDPRVSDSLQDPLPPHNLQKLKMVMPTVNQTYFLAIATFDRHGNRGQLSNILPVILFTVQQTVFPTQGPGDNEGSSSGLSTGAIAAIVVVLIIAALLVCLLVFYRVHSNATDGKKPLRTSSQVSISHTEDDPLVNEAAATALAERGMSTAGADEKKIMAVDTDEKETVLAPGASGEKAPSANPTKAEDP